MRVGIDEALARISERTADNYQYMKENLRQRRNQVTDLYGVEYYRQADGGSPASFYISISPDMVYLERFQFKLIIQPFVSTVSSGGVDSVEVQVENTSLRVQEDGDGYKVNPNPHKHDTVPHTHNVVLDGGISMTHTVADDFEVRIDDIDVTPYLMAQYGSWIDGEGVYPSLTIGEDYDILEVASDLVAEGNKDLADKLLRPGYKKVEISSSSPFSVVLVNYLKFSHLNR